MFKVFFSGFVSDATQVILLPDKGSPDVSPKHVLMEFASNGVILVHKK